MIRVAAWFPGERFARRVAGWAVVGMVVGTTACGSGASSSAAPAEAPVMAGKKAPVDVPADGKRFEPPAEKAQMPDGAWICDMGTVHYARMTPGDGECPVCGMKLVQHKH
jgi:hypothetical protein